MSIRESLGPAQHESVPNGITRTTTTLRVTRMATRYVLALVLFGASLPKLSGSPEMVTMFDDIGGGTAMRILVGLCEMAGAVGLVLPVIPRVPRLRLAAALGLTVLLLGASVTNVVVLHKSPVLPLALATAAVLVAHGSRRR